jgi:hypothetical protein
MINKMMHVDNVFEVFGWLNFIMLEEVGYLSIYDVFLLSIFFISIESQVM